MIIRIYIMLPPPPTIKYALKIICKCKSPHLGIKNAK